MTPPFNWREAEETIKNLQPWQKELWRYINSELLRVEQERNKHTMNPLEEAIITTVRPLIQNEVDKIEHKIRELDPSTINKIIDIAKDTSKHEVIQVVQQISNNIRDNLVATLDSKLENEKNNIIGNVFTEMNKLESKLRDEIKNNPGGGGGTIKVEVIYPDKTDTHELGPQHQEFETLLKLVSLNVPVYAHGPAGSGKTTATINVAKALGLTTYRKVMSRDTSLYELFGYNDQNGKYVEGILYRPYKDGGLFLADEVDNGNPNTNTALKQVWDTDECYFPCGMVQKHKDFRIVANANTVGNGANSHYIGRNQQDKAFLNIFSFIQWDYDEVFEKKICREEWDRYNVEKKPDTMFEAAFKSLLDFRTAVGDLAMNHIVSPRNTKMAMRLLAAGMQPTQVKEVTLYRGLTGEERIKLEEKVKVIAARGRRSPDDAWGQLAAPGGAF